MRPVMRPTFCERFSDRDVGVSDVRVVVDVGLDPFVGFEDILNVVVDEEVVRVEMLLDQTFDLEKGR
jgi:hypothetical protein